MTVLSLAAEMIELIMSVNCEALFCACTYLLPAAAEMTVNIRVIMVAINAVSNVFHCFFRVKMWS